MFLRDRAERQAIRRSLPGADYFAPRVIEQRFEVDGVVSPDPTITWVRPLEAYAEAITGTGQSFGLGPGQHTRVRGLVLRIPSNALPGRYESDIVVYGSAGGAGASLGGRAVLGAGASTHLIIHVARRQA